MLRWDGRHGRTVRRERLSVSRENAPKATSENRESLNVKSFRIAPPASRTFTEICLVKIYDAAAIERCPMLNDVIDVVKMYRNIEPATFIFSLEINVERNSF